jgi:hypothetical protein
MLHILRCATDLNKLVVSCELKKKKQMILFTLSPSLMGGFTREFIDISSDIWRDVFLNSVGG